MNAGGLSAYSFAVVNCNTGILASDMSSVSFSSRRVAVSSCTTGILSDRSSLIDTSSHAIICSCDGQGIGANHASHLIADQALLIDNNTGATATSSSSIALTPVVSRSWSQETLVGSDSFIG